MQNLTAQAHEYCKAALQPGDIVIDATAGNGHDTLFLAQLVKPQGSVFSFDIQSSAIEKTSKRLSKNNVSNVTLFENDHTCMTELIPEKYHGHIAAIMFNLGYLPSGDKTLVTTDESTISAINQALMLLRSQGILTVICYTGHPGGQEEADAVLRLVENLSANEFSVSFITAQKESLSPPQLVVVQKR